MRALAGQIFSGLFMVGLLVGFVGKGFMPAPLMDWISNNSMLFYGALFVLNMVGGNLQQTGAFEVSIDGEQVFSKLETGNLPDLNWLAQAIQQKLSS